VVGKPGPSYPFIVGPEQEPMVANKTAIAAILRKSIMFFMVRLSSRLLHGLK
jgi:hypothetical protein